MRTTRIVIIFLMVSIIAFGTVSSINAVPAADEPTGTLKDILDRGYLIVGSDTTYPPFEEYNETLGRAEGFDIDIAHQIALALDVKLKVVTSEWDPIIPNLKNKQFDMIISAMTITEEREQEVDFSRWYYKSFQAILVMKDNPLNIQSPADLNQSLTIGVQAGTTSFLWAQDNLNDSLVTVKTYDTILQAISALKQGSVDVVLGDYAVLALDEVDSAETKVVATYSPEDFGIAMREGDTDLVNAVNDALDELLGSDPDNPNPSDLYNIIYYKWFGASDPNYKGTVTTGTIPTAEWYSESSPGFEYIVVFAAIVVAVPIIRKYRK